MALMADLGSPVEGQIIWLLFCWTLVRWPYYMTYLGSPVEVSWAHERWRATSVPWPWQVHWVSRSLEPYCCAPISLTPVVCAPPQTEYLIAFKERKDKEIKQITLFKEFIYQTIVKLTRSFQRGRTRFEMWKLLSRDSHRLLSRCVPVLAISNRVQRATRRWGRRSTGWSWGQAWPWGPTLSDDHLFPS